MHKVFSSTDVSSRKSEEVSDYAPYSLTVIANVLRDTHELESKHYLRREIWRKTQETTKAENDERIKRAQEQFDLELEQIKQDVSETHADLEKFETDTQELIRQIQSEAVQSKQQIQAKTRDMIERRLAQKQSLKKRIDDLLGQIEERDRLVARKTSTVASLKNEVEQQSLLLHNSREHIRDLTDRIRTTSQLTKQTHDEIRSLHVELSRSDQLAEYIKLAGGNLRKSHRQVSQVYSDTKQRADRMNDLIESSVPRIARCRSSLSKYIERKARAVGELKISQGDLVKALRMRENMQCLITTAFQYVHKPEEFANSLRAVHRLKERS